MQDMFQIIIICFIIKVQAASPILYYIFHYTPETSKPKTIIKHNNIKHNKKNYIFGN